MTCHIIIIRNFEAWFTVLLLVFVIWKKKNTKVIVFHHLLYTAPRFAKIKRYNSPKDKNCFVCSAQISASGTFFFFKICSTLIVFSCLSFEKHNFRSLKSLVNVVYSAKLNIKDNWELWIVMFVYLSGIYKAFCF